MRKCRINKRENKRENKLNKRAFYFLLILKAIF